MNDCFYCENGEKLRSLMLEICELPYSKVYLNRDQKHRGRCIVALKEHKTEYFQLDPAENAGYFAEVSRVAKAIYDLYHPDKINYATYGDGVPHVHVHIVPKYRDGLNWGAPFDDTLPKVLLSDEEYGEMIAALREEILK
ncbi:MAG: HIT family protein [Oscillibacter sp.]|nr:HIT family protein [Oscillibacter sp.]